MKLAEWVEIYGQAWRDADAQRAADLFTDDATYCEHLLQQSAQGRDEIEQYWREAAGCLLLRFAPDGRCEELREYWFVEPGTHPPPAIWGR